MTNMNSSNRAIAMNYLSVRDGRKCNTKLGHGCGKSFSQLLEENKNKEEQTGIKRTLPIIVIDRIDNSGIHKIDIYDEYLMNEYQLLCWSCHRKKDPHRLKTTQATGRKPSREKQDSLQFEPTYHKNLKIYLQDNQEGCFIELMMNSKNFSDGANQVTCKRYFEDETFTKINHKALYQRFPFKCNSENCNGVHICLVGLKPVKLITIEQQHLESKWWNDYGSLREVWKQRASLSLKHFMELDEYIETHSQLIVYNFQ